MDKHYTYLLINFLTVFFPVVLSFDKKVRFFNAWKNIFPGLLISGALFLIWDHIFTIYNVWSFNNAYITGIFLFKLPVEEILFFFTIPFACIFIYECLNVYIKRNLPGPRASGIISLFLVLLSVVMLICWNDRVYTLITFGLLVILAAILLFSKPPYAGRFYLAYVVSLIPFYIVNGLLTSLPVVLYNDLQNCGIRAGTIPLEDHFYSLSLILMNVMFFEYFRGKKSRPVI